MPLLYERTKDDDGFVLTPDFDAMLEAWVLENPDYDDGPGFTRDEAKAFTFVWPTPSPSERRRAEREAKAKTRAAPGKVAKPVE